ncbi:hypothetical protein D9756_008366 [Leucocoprinus leucothites]|uniref:Uncharacterized protein n=1 Tax=Leucocoprinus leucothites TaxID=201217 RepID=A0A8H5D040_9AGAR|nr:hypothetical protein D9756_008366 [Leucoagaricus leucothites]
MLMYDLDSTNPTQQCLFSPSSFDKDPVMEYVGYTFWFDRSSPYLSFYVAGNVSDSVNPRQFIYSVQLKGHGASATLTATLAASFCSYGHQGWYAGRSALNKHYYTEIRGDPNDHRMKDIFAYYFKRHLKAPTIVQSNPLPKPVSSGKIPSWNPTFLARP